MKRALLLVALCAAGCNDIDVNQVAGRGAVGDERVTVTVGEASGIELDLDADEDSRMRSLDPNIIDVAEGADPHTFVVFGVAAGRSTLVIEVDGDDEQTLEAEVLPREP